MKEITYEGVNFLTIIERTEKLLEIWNQMPENPNPERRSGYLTLMCRGAGKILFVWMFGDPPAEKADKYCRLSQEKARRLFLHQKDGHISSFQSRDPQKNKWGGAIAASQFILSFSGLPDERADEAIVLCLGMCNWMTINDVNKILEISENQFFFPLHSKF